MRSQNIFMLGICVLVAAAIGYFMYVHQSPQAVLSSIAAQFSRPRAAAAEEPAPMVEEKKEKAARVRPVRSTVAVAVAEAPTPVPETRASVAPPRQPHPAPTDVATGLERGQLLRRYPAPALQTSTIKDGDLIELVVYQIEDQKVATFVQLQNGVVTHVYAGMAPRQLPR